MEVYQFTIEDQQRDLQNMMALMPIARTAMGKEDGKALADYSKSLAKEIGKMTPWLNTKKSNSGLKGLRKRVKSGTTVVIPDASDGANNPLYKDAAIRKESR